MKRRSFLQALFIAPIVAIAGAMIPKTTTAVPFDDMWAGAGSYPWPKAKEELSIINMDGSIWICPETGFYRHDGTTWVKTKP